MSSITYKIDTPDKFTKKVKLVFEALLVKQNKVQNVNAEKVERCKFICFFFADSQIVSIAALKPKTTSDFNSNKANLEHLSNDFAWEIGYCYTEPEHTGKGYSSALIALILKKSPNINLMASTELRLDNSMPRILERNGFVLSGQTWKSAIHGGELGLYLKFKAAP